VLPVQQRLALNIGCKVTAKFERLGGYFAFLPILYPEPNDTDTITARYRIHILQSQVLIDKNYQLCYIYPKFNEGVASGIFRNKSTIAASVNDRYLAYFKL
jgi:hypothetical protein